MSCSGLLPHTRAVLCARQMPCHAMPCQAKPRYGRHFEHLPLALLPLPSLLLFTHSRLCCRPYLPLGKQRHIKWCISTHSSSSPFYPATVRFVPSPPPTAHRPFPPTVAPGTISERRYNPARGFFYTSTQMPGRQAHAGYTSETGDTPLSSASAPLVAVW